MESLHWCSGFFPSPKYSQHPLLEFGNCHSYEQQIQEAHGWRMADELKETHNNNDLLLTSGSKTLSTSSGPTQQAFVTIDMKCYAML